MISSRYRTNQLKYLCSLIGSNPSEIEFITKNIDEYYTEWFEEKINKNTGELKTFKDGTVKKRAIRPSLKRLKIIQSSIKNNILAQIRLPENIHGGVKGRNNITNAKPHQGNKFKFTTDLKEFYPSVKHKKVYGTFLTLGYSNHIAHWLTKLTTWKRELPQGTHTSTHLANLVFLATDVELIKLCNFNNITYTRYIDDLTFSSQQDFKHLINQILKIITKAEFKINYRKTSYKGHQTITGVEVFNNFIDAPNEIKDKAAKEIANNSEMKPYTNYLQNIRKTNIKK